MTTEEFRSLALSFPETSESSHMNHPDFRVGGRIFATLGYPNQEWGMVKLPPPQQHAYVEAEPDAFVPAKGAWGRQGSTNVKLAAASGSMVRNALAEAWQQAAQTKPAVKQPRTQVTAPAAPPKASTRRRRSP
ncbi:MAG: MmcQ/YjbR family DNA-binding protein [Acidobacteriota bacterium]|nr:MmcQ/YjbR family DNA-binding protein [Acidobacteriota bacterium]